MPAANTTPLYTSCNAIRMGITPILYLGATILGGSKWQKGAASKMRTLKREGLYNGEHFAKALDLIDIFRAHLESNSSIEVSGAGNITPILFPDAEDKSLAIYYSRDLTSTTIGNATSVEVLGRACWSKPCDGNSESLAIDFYEEGHSMNRGVLDRCVYRRIAENEPNVASWKTLFSLPNMLIAVT